MTYSTPDQRNGRFKHECNGGYPYGELTKVIKAVPIRKHNGAWIMTADHKAQAWALGVFKRGHPAEINTKVRFVSKKEAEATIRATRRAIEGPTKPYRLGARMKRVKK